MKNRFEPSWAPNNRKKYKNSPHGFELGSPASEVIIFVSEPTKLVNIVLRYGYLFWNHEIQISIRLMNFQDIYSHLWKVQIFSGNIYTL